MGNREENYKAALEVVLEIIRQASPNWKTILEIEKFVKEVLSANEKI